MSRNGLRFCHVAIATALACCSITACGNDGAASEPVAMVGTTTITRAQYVSWLKTFPGGELLSPASATGASPDLSRCVAAKRATAAAYPSTPSRADLRKSCAQDYQGVSAETLRFLITDVWLRREAEHRHVAVPPSAVTKAMTDIRRQFRRGGGLAAYIADSGMSRRQFQARVRRDLLAHRLMTEIEDPDLEIEPAEIAAYYRKHESEYDLPATRDVRQVVAKTRARAAQARAALGRGLGWDEAVRRYSQDMLSRRNGGHGVVGSDNAIEELRTLAFGSPPGEIIGPVSIGTAWWVFTVTGSHPARQQSLSEVEGRIRTSLRSARESRALDRMTSYLSRAYKRETICAPGYEAVECGSVESTPGE
jgi:hypothetical protein